MLVSFSFFVSVHIVFAHQIWVELSAQKMEVKKWKNIRIVKGQTCWNYALFGVICDTYTYIGWCEVFSIHNVWKGRRSKQNTFCFRRGRRKYSTAKAKAKSLCLAGFSFIPSSFLSGSEASMAALTHTRSQNLFLARTHIGRGADSQHTQSDNTLGITKSKT